MQFNSSKYQLKENPIPAMYIYRVRVGREMRWSLSRLTGHWTSPHEQWTDSRGTAMILQSRVHGCVCVCIVCVGVVLALHDRSM